MSLKKKRIREHTNFSSKLETMASYQMAMPVYIKGIRKATSKAGKPYWFVNTVTLNKTPLYVTPANPDEKENVAKRIIL